MRIATIVGTLALLPTLASAQMVPMRSADAVTRNPPSLFRFREADVTPDQLEPITKPDLYREIWNEALACSGRQSPVAYENVSFQAVKVHGGFLVHGMGPFIGYTFTQKGDARAEIWLVKGWEWNWGLVKHEMLHAILGHEQRPVHPTDMGLRCGVW